MPDQNHDDDKRQRILEATFAVCEEKGVHAARMEEVAALAQVSKGTLYRFFESKEDLILATIISSYAAASRETGAGATSVEEPVAPATQLLNRLEGMAKALAVVTPRSRVHYQAFGVVADSPSAQARLDEFLSRFHRERQAEYEDFIRAGQKQGSFRPDADPTTVGHTIGALLSGFIYRSAFDPASATPQALRACFDTLLRDLLGYSATARPAEAEPDE